MVLILKTFQIIIVISALSAGALGILELFSSSQHSTTTQTFKLLLTDFKRFPTPIKTNQDYAIYELVKKNKCYLGTFKLISFSSSFLEFDGFYPSSRLKDVANHLNLKIMLILDRNTNNAVPCDRWVGSWSNH